MIAKITRGTRVGDIGAYLHGPGKANEHHYLDATGQTRIGGIVIASNIGAHGHTDPSRWAKEIRAAQATRPEIIKPIWQASLRNTPGDRIMTNHEWADAGQTFAERMGFDDHPWVMVRHGQDHVHIVVSRISYEGTIWHARNDRRQAQTACTELERIYGLEKAPRQRTTPKQPTKDIHDQQRIKATQIAEQRQLLQKAAELQTVSFPASAQQAVRKPRRPPRTRPGPTPAHHPDKDIER